MNWFNFTLGILTCIAGSALLGHSGLLDREYWGLALFVAGCIKFVGAIEKWLT